MQVKLLVLVLVCGAMFNTSCKNAAHSKGSGEQVITNFKDSMTVAFYNVENLFDTKDDPATMDEDFTPSGKLHWDDERYQKKLERVAEVIEMLPGDLPDVVGVCEVENLFVLQDLLRQNLLQSKTYAILHQNSPDERGIDLAMIYDSSKIKLLENDFIPVVLEDENDPNTRDILYAKTMVEGSVIHYFVNHWPSRGGGQMESEPNRLLAARILRSKVDAIISKEPDARILIMGDFNDHPVDKSISEVLQAGIKQDDVLVNFMFEEHKSGKGSYFYKGEWGALDQFMATPALANTKSGWHASNQTSHIFYNEKILFRDSENVARPNRTYAGDSYKGGYSDHLPVYIKLYLN